MVLSVFYPQPWNGPGTSLAPSARLRKEQVKSHAGRLCPAPLPAPTPPPPASCMRGTQSFYRVELKA